MKARKFDLTPMYVDLPGGGIDWQAIAKELSPKGIPKDILDKHTLPKPKYPMVENIAELLFAREMGLRKLQAFQAQDLAQKLAAASADHVLLTEDEYGLLQRASNAMTNVRRIDVPLLRRIEATPEVEVEEKVEAKPDGDNS